MNPLSEELCIVNAVDTLRNVAKKHASRSCSEQLVAECFYQQDQALLWGADSKIVVTAEPIAEMDWLTGQLGLENTRNLTPKRLSEDLFADLLSDSSVLAQIIASFEGGHPIRTFSHTSVPACFKFREEMLRSHGTQIDLIECPSDLMLRDRVDRKSGFRAFFGDLGRSFKGVRLPPGSSCTTFEEAFSTIRMFLGRSKACIAKPDRGEASIGLTIFGANDDPADLEQRLRSNHFLRGEPIVVEEYIHGEDVFFPSIEYEIGRDQAQEPRMTHMCKMLFEGPTILRGNVTSSDFEREEWSANLEAAGDAIALALMSKGYVGHFGIDAVAQGGDVYLLELNSRRTGSTHLDDFGRRYFGPDYCKTMSIGHYDFFCPGQQFELARVLKAIGTLFASPLDQRVGVFPFEITGFRHGRLSFLVFASSYEHFMDLIAEVRMRLQV